MILAIDLGGTKLATALFSESGTQIKKDSVPLGGRTGRDVGKMIMENISVNLALAESPVVAIGVSVPGIRRDTTLIHATRCGFSLIRALTMSTSISLLNPGNAA